EASGGARRIYLIQAVDASAQWLEVARDARVVGVEHGEALEDLERAEPVAALAVDAREVEQHAGDDLRSGQRLEHRRLDLGVGAGHALQERGQRGAVELG